MTHNVTIDQIIHYWLNHMDECGIGIDWSEAHERCWRCGYKTKLEKAHIIPDSLLGVKPSQKILFYYAVVATVKPQILKMLVLCGFG